MWVSGQAVEKVARNRLKMAKKVKFKNYANLVDKTYVRRASQGTWHTQSVGTSISVLVDVER